MCCSKAALRQPLHAYDSLWGKQWLQQQNHNEIAFNSGLFLWRRDTVRKSDGHAHSNMLVLQNEKPDGCAFTIALSKVQTTPLPSPTHPSLILFVHQSPFILLKACRGNSSSRCGKDQMTSTEPAAEETKSAGWQRWAGNPSL